VLGTTLTFTTAPSSGTQNIYVRYLSTTTQAIVPSQGTVNTAQLGLITTIPTTGGNTITLPASTGTALVAATALTVPNTTGTVMVSGNMPTFSYYQSATQTLASATATKLTFTTADWDTTGGMYASSRFTPTVAGYYQVSGSMGFNAASSSAIMYIYKNGADYKRFTNTNPALISSLNGSALVYCNGSTDYIELYGFSSVGQALINNSQNTYFQAVLVRSA
jgi:hypothetical protein